MLDDAFAPLLPFDDLLLTHGRDGARRLLPADQHRYVDLAAEVMGDDKADPAFLYSGFAMTALPHRRPVQEDRPWERENGRYSMAVEPGWLRCPDGEMRFYGVPYGSRARLIMIYLQTQAIRNGTPEVSLGGSLHDWLGRMGVPAGGTSYAAIREQAKRLSACRMTVGWCDNTGSGFERANIVSSAIFLTGGGDDPRQGRLWDEVVRLSVEFWAALKVHAVPINETALRLIQNSSAVIDVYVWLCYRLARLDRTTTVPWPALRAQFGTEYKHLWKFREKFIPALREAVAVYPEARLEITDQGVVLKPSRPAVPRL